MPSFPLRLAQLHAAVVGFLTFGSILGATCLEGQSIDLGQIEGVVRAPDGRVLQDVLITVASEGVESAVEVRSLGDGEFLTPSLAAGVYELRLEMLGYQPLLLRDVEVRPGDMARLTIELELAVPPVESVDTVFVRMSNRGRFDAEGGRWISASEVDLFPDRGIGLGQIGTLSPLLDQSLGSEGMPGSGSTIVLDGLPFTPVRHPLQWGGGGETPLLPRTAVSSVSVHRAADVEWWGSSGAYVSVRSRAGTGSPNGDLAVSSTGNQLWQTAPFSDVREPEMSSIWATGAADLPLDSNGTWLFLSAEGMRARTPQLSPFSDGIAERIVEARPPAPGVRPEDLSGPWLQEQEAVSASARLDRTLPGATVMARVSFSSMRLAGGEFLAGPLRYGTIVPSDGTDILAGASLSGAVHPRVTVEVLLGFQQSQRSWSDTQGRDEPSTDPATRFAENGSVLGLDPALPGRVHRTEFNGRAVGHLTWSKHRIKGGITASVPFYEYEYLYGSNGEFLFGTPERLAGGEGVFSQTVGPSGPTTFTLPEVGLFVQDLWEPFQGVRLTMGVRVDRENLPADRVALNARWEELTGLSNRSFASGLAKVSPRVAVSWDITGSGGTLVEATAASHHGRIDPGAISEVLSLSGSVRSRKQIRELRQWPSAPHGAGAEAEPSILTLLGPKLAAPQTARATLGLSSRVGNRTILGIVGTVRHTRFLLRRSDLNLTLRPSGTLVDGRPVYGTLAKVGSVLTAEPGMNRRFSEFDIVWALEADGWSDYRGVAVFLEHAIVDWLELHGSYAYSKTEDNLMGLRLGIPEAQLEPRPDVGASQDWREGTSDLDVPHRLSAGLSARLPILAGIDIAATYRYESGLPYTPGYRAGVDVNGDGSGWNDPAVVEAGGQGPFDCLSANIGSIARRNGCRTGDSHLFDVGLSVGLLGDGPVAAALTVDFFNLLDQEMGWPDTALWIADDEGSLERDAATHEIGVPFSKNPTFGQVTQPVRSGRMIRIGLRVILP